MATRVKVREILELLRTGFAVYEGKIEAEVYDRLRCPRAAQAQWFAKEGTYICISCDRRCLLQHPEGFQLMLPMPEPRACRVVVADAPAVTVEQLLSFGRPLKAQEAAWALNVSEREVYYLADEGVLQRVGGRPLRVTPESVRAQLEGKA
jgi:hypothetical protein